MLTMPRSWWVLRAFTPNSLAVDSAVVGAPATSDPIEVGVGRRGIARCSPTLIVGNQQLLVSRVQHNRGRGIAHRDHALDGIRRPPVVEVDNCDGVGVVECDIGDVVPGIDGDRVRTGAVDRFVFSRNADRQPEADLAHFACCCPCRSPRWCRHRYWRPAGSCPTGPCLSDGGRP